MAAYLGLVILLSLHSFFNYNHFFTLDSTEGEAEARPGGGLDCGLRGRQTSSRCRAGGDRQSPTLGAARLVRLI